MKHVATAGFWRHYDALPPDIRALADKSFSLMKSNPRHPSLQLKRVDDYWSARVNLSHRALGIDHAGGIAWIWIGRHADYDQKIR